MSSGTNLPSVVLVPDMQCADLAEQAARGLISQRTFTRLEGPDVMALLRTFGKLGANFPVAERTRFEGCLAAWSIPRPAEPQWPAIHAERCPVTLPRATLRAVGDAIMHVTLDHVHVYTLTASEVVEGAHA
ncbi:MAG: hypothetical protein J0M12_12245 [Deltaproteobacteria bacterium]|nr:hypothetical protein [Deltaproteobacteria bacterium]